MPDQDQAELQRARERAKLIPPGRKTAREAFPDEPTAMMIFPQPLTLAINHQTIVPFQAGPQEVPTSLIDHPYLKANGVKLFAGANVDEELDAAQKAVAEANARLDKAKAAKAAAVRNAEMMAKVNPQAASDTATENVSPSADTTVENTKKDKKAATGATK